MPPCHILLNSFWRTTTTVSNFATFWIHPFDTFLPILVGIPQVEHKILVISQNHPQNSLYISYKSLKYKIAQHFRLIHAINFILAPGNNIKGRNIFWNFGQISVMWRHVTSLLPIWYFFGFLVNLGPENDTLNYYFLKNPADM